MKRVVLLVVCVGLLPIAGFAQIFTPGNVIFADPFYRPDGQIVEFEFDEATGIGRIVQVIKWDIGEWERRRALGLDIDPNGNVWVGITSTGSNDPEDPYPMGLGEALRIEPDGTQTFFPTDLVKATHLAAIGANKVILNSNHTDDATLAQLVDVTSGEAVLTNFNKTGHGEALLLPDGRLLMGDSGTPGILTYDLSGGDPTGVFYDDGRTVRSLTYNDQIGSVIALLQDQHTLIKVSLDGELEAEYDAEWDQFVSLWGIAEIPGTTKIILGSHDIDETWNQMAIYDTANFDAGPTIIEIMEGFEEAGLAADHVFQSFFNAAVVPEFTSVSTWELH